MNVGEKKIIRAKNNGNGRQKKSGYQSDEDMRTQNWKYQKKKHGRKVYMEKTNGQIAENSTGTHLFHWVLFALHSLSCLVASLGWTGQNGTEEVEEGKGRKGGGSLWDGLDWVGRMAGRVKEGRWAGRGLGRYTGAEYDPVEPQQVTTRTLYHPCTVRCPVGRVGSAWWWWCVTVYWYYYCSVV